MSTTTFDIDEIHLMWDFLATNLHAGTAPLHEQSSVESNQSLQVGVSSDHGPTMWMDVPFHPGMTVNCMTVYELYLQCRCANHSVHLQYEEVVHVDAADRNYLTWHHQQKDENDGGS